MYYIGDSMPLIREPLYWDDGNVSSVERHGISPDEIEELLFGVDGEDAVYRIRRDGDYFKIFGETGSGRLLTLVGEFVDDGRFRVFHALEMRDDERRAYRRRKH